MTIFILENVWNNALQPTFSLLSFDKSLPKYLVYSLPESDRVYSSGMVMPKSHTSHYQFH